MAMAFDSSDTEQMSRALSLALAQLEPPGLLDGDTEAVAKTVLARAIVEAAEQGERDEHKLAAHKLAAYAISRYPQTREAAQPRPVE